MRRQGTTWPEKSCDRATWYRKEGRKKSTLTLRWTTGHAGQRVSRPQFYLGHFLERSEDIWQVIQVIHTKGVLSYVPVGYGFDCEHRHNMITVVASPPFSPQVPCNHLPLSLYDSSYPHEQAPLQRAPILPQSSAA